MSDNKYRVSGEICAELDFTSGLITGIEDSISPHVPLISSLDTVAMTIGGHESECLVENMPITKFMGNISPNHVHIPIDLSANNNESVVVEPDASTMATLPGTVSMETITSDISFEPIPADEIDMGSSLLPESPISMSLDTNETIRVLSVCPVINVLPVDDCTTSSDINFEDIELYLECTEDNENNCESVLVSHNMVQPGTSFLRSDMRLKISFPDYPEERDKGFKCSLCKNYFLMEEILREHIYNEHKTLVNICTFCTYNTKSKKFFENHMKTKHKEWFGETKTDMYIENVVNADVFINNMIDTSIVSILEEKTEINRMDLSKAAVEPDTSNHTSFISQIQMQTLANNQESFNTSDKSSDDLFHSTEDIQTFEQDSIPQTDGIDDFTAKEKKLLFVCEVCEFVTKSAKLLNCHQKTMHNEGEELLRCSDCNFTCKQKRSLNAHVKSHNGLFDFLCEICRKRFVTKSIYTRHMKTHRTDRDFVCDHDNCGKKFKTKGQVTDHRKKVHYLNNNPRLETNQNKSNQDNMEQCSLQNTCDKSVYVNFTNYNGGNSKCRQEKTLHKKNTNTSDKDKLQSRVTFNEDYNRMDSFKNSILDEKTSLTLAEDECITDSLPVPVKILTVITQSVETAEGPTNNIAEGRVDVKNKTFKCEKKPFKCSYKGCDKTFRDNFNLQNHACTHTGLKQITCSLCNFACVQKSSLNHHMKIKHCNGIKC